MTVLFSDGQAGSTQETAHDFSAWTDKASDSSAAPSVETSYPHHGSYDFKHVIEAGKYSAQWKIFVTTYPTASDRAYVQFTAVATTGKANTILEICDATDANFIATLGLGYSSGAKWRIAYLKNGSSVEKFGTTTPAINTVYCIELLVTVSGTVGVVTAYICDSSGTLLETITDSNFDNNDYGNIGSCAIGFSYWIESTFAGTLYTDCFVCADAYIGPEAAAGGAGGIGGFQGFAQELTLTL